MTNSNQHIRRGQAELATRARLSPIRWTHLQHMLESPAHYLDSFHDDAIDRRDPASGQGAEDSRDQRIARAVNAYVLGGREPAVFDGERRGVAWDRFQRAHGGGTGRVAGDVLTLAENDSARYAADAIESSDLAMSVLVGGEANREIRWKRNGRDCVGHPDYVSPRFVTAIKVVRSVHPVAFQALATRKGWPVQLAMYADGLTMADHPNADSPRDHYLVAAQSRRPYLVTVFHVSAFWSAIREFCKAFDRIIECERTDRWPGYAESVVELVLPPMASRLMPDDDSAAIDGHGV